MLTVHTALVIYTNPHDLQIMIGRERKDDGLYNVGIFRGLGDRYMPLITSIPFATTQDEAIGVLRQILETVIKHSTQELTNPGSIISQILNPDQEEIDQSRVMTAELLDRIIDELRLKQFANTWEMIHEGA